MAHTSYAALNWRDWGLVLVTAANGNLWDCRDKSQGEALARRVALFGAYAAISPRHLWAAGVLNSSADGRNGNYIPVTANT